MVLKASQNPSIVSPWVSGLSELSGRWWIAHTKARQEKALAWDLQGRKVGYFLPLYDKTIFSGGRKRHVKMPLFASYVFLCGDKDDRRSALETNRVCQIIEVDDQICLQEELLTFERLILEGARLDPCPVLEPGTLCRVTAGPFEGLRGTVIKKRSQTRFAIRLSALAQGALLDIDASLLEPVDTAD